MRQVHLTDAGAVCSIGTSVPAICAAVRGRVDGFRSYRNFPAARDGRPLVMARVPMSAPVPDAVHRMAAMADRAAQECVTASGGADAVGRLPVFLALPGQRPGWEEADMLAFFEGFQTRLACQTDPENSALFPSGHFGGLAALGAGFELVRSGVADRVMVGGVASLDAPYLDILDRFELLKGPDTPFGFIPGEAAGFVMLCAADILPQERALSPCLTDWATAEEPSPWYALDGPPGGKGLSETMISLLPPDGSEGQKADVAYSDHNGEHWRAEEWSTAYLRTGPRHGHPLDHRHPADCWGDVDAATGPLLAMLAAYDMHRDGHRSALLCCSGLFNALRAGVLMHAASPLPVTEFERNPA